jgi:hypothetical protein
LTLSSLTSKGEGEEANANISVTDLLFDQAKVAVQMIHLYDIPGGSPPFVVSLSTCPRNLINPLYITLRSLERGYM